MEIRTTGTAPLAPTAREAIPPELQAWISGFPQPQAGQLEAAYREGVASGALKPGESSPVKLLAYRPAVGAQAMHAWIAERGRSEAAMRQLREATLRAAQARQAFLAAEKLRLDGEDSLIRETLGKIRVQDLQVALEAGGRDARELDQRGLLLEQVEDAVRSGLIAVVAAPVAGHTQLEGQVQAGGGQRATLSEARADEETRGDVLRLDGGERSGLALADFGR